MYHPVPSIDSDASSNLPNSQQFRSIRSSILLSYFMASWARRGMEFTIALVLIDLYPDSLLLVSIYGLVDNSVRVTLGGVIGSYLDRAERWPGARNCYMLQNGLIFGAGAGMSVVLSGVLGEPGTPTEDMKVWYWLVVVASLGMTSVSGVGSLGITIAVEKNLPKQLCGEDSSTLSQLNASFRAIDLVCQLASPILSGCLMTYLQPPAAVMALGTYGFLAWVPELWLLQRAFSASAKLRAPKTVVTVPLDLVTGSNGTIPQLKVVPGVKKSSWGVYFRQHLFLANMSLALLYMTVLSLGFLMTSYLRWCGLTEAEVSLYRGVGALTGLLATLIFPAVRKKIGVAECGFLGISYQLLTLSIGVIPVILYCLEWRIPFMRTFVGDREAAAISNEDLLQGVPSLGITRLLISAVVASRTGLWLFDLAMTQLVQEEVQEFELGTVCGVQSSIQAGCETLSFLAGVFLKDPTEFWTLMLGSLCVVSAAWLLYAIYMSRRNRVGASPYSEADPTSWLREQQQHGDESVGLLSEQQQNPCDEEDTAP
ncbi:hypothetical protein CEUSTIGMA_g1392.t1 [Chlamydomonas eustigma]|uniref:Solute carrier family 40 member n=1 Tax=Chlamydomonas eustigma TaxID=1157962 RepID=A0A250WTH8_9CHLO|nr:hypothetical protein CEUSTIGMA_g1392.t1 [Chlamydomonas eustigma]|eukprot:GAX73942.1 hypothetical protein CEUSTIGMA_g1392.t1 [Chlamydomonas eustigma]